MVAQYNNTSANQIKKIFENAGVESIKYDDYIYKEAGLNPVPLIKSRSIMQMLEATVKRTNYNLNNLIMTTVNTSQAKFYESMNKAYLEISTGVKSYSQSILDAISNLSQNGATIQYPSGRKISLESAVRMNIVTSLNQACGRIQEIRADEMGWDLMEITAHSGARPTHAKWQGKIVSRSGQKGYLSLKDIGYREITGFKGINCSHDWHPFYKNSTKTYNDKELRKIANEKVEYNGVKISKYEAQQLQRKMERQLRQDKKDVVALNAVLTSNTTNEELLNETKEKLKSKKMLQKKHNDTFKDFLTQTGFRKDYSRLKI